MLNQLSHKCAVTLLLEIGSECLDLNGLFVFDVKIEGASNKGAFLDISVISLHVRGT